MQFFGKAKVIINSYSNKDNELDIKQLEVKSIIRKIENLVEPIIDRGIEV